MITRSHRVRRLDAQGTRMLLWCRPDAALCLVRDELIVGISLSHGGTFFVCYDAGPGMGEKARELLIIDKRPWMTQGICLACRKKFLSRLRDPETCEWEIRIEFERHECKSFPPPTKS
jgi:hypothetical protein